MKCIHCGDALRRDGLALVAESDDTTTCHAAPLRRCGYCSGDGCGTCEGNGEVYGPHAAESALGPLDRAAGAR